MSTNTEQRGFTLVELAVVMTIVGLLIGGILKGQELMMNARRSATIAQVQSYQSAVSVFRDNYNGIPGDYPRALTTLPGCNAGNNCNNGDGNSLVGVLSPAWSTVSNVIVSENVQFWKHLVMADLIAGVTPGGGPMASWGETHPSAKIAGGFHVKQALQQTSVCGTPSLSCMSGVTLMLKGQIDGTFGGGPSTQLLPPSSAYFIDAKIDDGAAYSGHVQAVSEAFIYGCGNPNVSGQDANGYNLRLTGGRCDMFFKI